MKYKVGDRVRIKPTLNTDDTTPDCWVSAKMIIKRGQIYPIVKITSCGLYGLDLDNSKDDCWWFTEDMLEPADSKTLRMADGTVIGEFAKEGIIGEFKGIPVYATGGTVSIHDLPTNEWYNPMRLTFKNGSSIEALPNTSDIIRNTSDFCTGFRGGNTPKSVKMEVIKDRTKTVKDWVDSLSDVWAKLGCTSFIMSPDEIKKMEEKKMPTKFTFYVTEGTRPDKSCNGTIPTMTTTVTNGLDEASVTCDKVDFNERQGVLEGIAQLYCKGRFDREYEAAVKLNKRNDKVNRTCVYCRKIFDTAEERVEHEKWHVERKKARRERYLLRKRAKEIAFEEQAQKMAKEIIAEDNKK